MKKIKLGIFILFLFIALVLTFLGKFIIPIGERVSSGAYVPGLPFTIFDANSKGCAPMAAGCINLDFLPLFFVIDIIIWILVLYLLNYLLKKIKKIIK